MHFNWERKGTYQDNTDRELQLEQSKTEILSQRVARENEVMLNGVS